MGLRDKFKDIPKRFRPIDLNEENVDAVIAKCLFHPSDDLADRLRYITLLTTLWL